MTVIFDATGATARAGFGVSSDLTVADFFAVDANGFSTGIGTFDAINFAGYFVDDSTPVGRQFGGLSLDGTFNDLSLADPNGVPRVFANQAALTTVDKNDHAGNGFGIRDASGNDNVGMFALADGLLSGFD
ncbi:MAG: hypothetical protein ACREQC_12015, partial [Candidatus Binataceae bacterium]